MKNMISLIKFAFQKKNCAQLFSAKDVFIHIFEKPCAY